MTKPLVRGYDPGAVVQGDVTAAKVCRLSLPAFRTLRDCGALPLAPICFRGPKKGIPVYSRSHIMSAYQAWKKVKSEELIRGYDELAQELGTTPTLARSLSKKGALGLAPEFKLGNTYCFYRRKVRLAARKYRSGAYDDQGELLLDKCLRGEEQIAEAMQANPASLRHRIVNGYVTLRPVGEDNGVRLYDPIEAEDFVNGARRSKGLPPISLYW